MRGLGDSYPNNLPAPLTSFVGRDQEIVEVKRRLSGARLMTLIGAGGCGKTRLALRVAAELAAEYDDDVCLVEFARLSDSEMVPQMIAASLGVPENNRRLPVESIAEDLRARPVLLLFDNCEHLVDACAQVAVSLLSLCPRLRILATSREALNVPGEVVWPVAPLSVPAGHVPRKGSTGVSALLEYEAVRLFLERAAAGAPELTLTEQNASAVVDICRRLDGIPLAIELAAARVRALPVDQIAERLSTHDPFRLLTGGSRTAPARHQTLEATLSWSYDLLAEMEQSVLQRLAVFAGGATLGAAEGVCSSDKVASHEVLDVLSRLVDKSLVVADTRQGEARYLLLETIREYALARLEESGQAALARELHLDYFVHWAEAAEPRLIGSEQRGWLERFEAEHDNIRSALRLSLDPNEGPARCLRLAGASGRFWRLHGHFREGRGYLASALSRSEDRSAARCQALFWAGTLAYLQSDYPAARTMLEECLAIRRELGPEHKAGVAYALNMLGEVAIEVGDYGNATRLFEEALSMYRELNDARGIGDQMMMLGWAAMRTGEYQAATTWLQESLPFTRKGRSPTHIAEALAGLGEVAVRQGQLDGAQSLLEESQAISRDHGDKWGMAATLGSLGWVAFERRDFGRMRTLLGDSLDLRTEIGDRGGSAWCLEKLAAATVLMAQPLQASSRSQALQRAVRLFGAAAGLRAPGKSVVDQVDQPKQERILADLMAALGEEVFASAWAEGSDMPLPEVVDYALQEPVPPAVAASLESARTEKQRFGGLTERERQVATWVSQGKSNREIAQNMVVGVRTVETYVTRILNKLGFDSRVQIATWAVERGLGSPSQTSTP